MELTLHKLKEDFVITSDDKPLRDYKGLMLNRVSLSLTNDMGVSLMGWFLKVIAQQDQIDFSSLTEEEQKEIGWFDIKNLINRLISKGFIHPNDGAKKEGVELGFQKAQELLSDRVFTLKELLDFLNNEDNHIEGELGNSCIDVRTLINFVSQPISWKIEVEMERTRYPKGDDGWEDVYKPKFTGGKLKILKIKH